MNILVTGAQGYVGSLALSQFANLYNVKGLDIGFFKHAVFDGAPNQHGVIQKDIRDINIQDLIGFNTIVHLAAISNDPMGEKFSQATSDINFFSTIRLAKMSKDAGVSKFIFASSASVYGSSNQNICNEDSELNPLTTYAISKLKTEIELKEISDDYFKIVCFRFATACGYSPRLRLDLVLNEFIYQAISAKRISLNSSGNAFRPLIDVKEMVAAIEWAIRVTLPSNFEIINGGFNSWNFKVIELAELVANLIPFTSIQTKKFSIDDKRSYKLDFSKAQALGIFRDAPSINNTILLLKSKLEIYLDSMVDANMDDFKRLLYLDRLLKNKIIDTNLKLS